MTTMVENPMRRGPVMLATDGTGSGTAVLAARLVAERLGVPLEVVTVVDPQPMYGGSAWSTSTFLSDVDDLRRIRRVETVHGFLARFSGGAAPPSIHVRFGGIAEEIANVASERNATLIVMGAAPHHRGSRTLGGERAVHVLRNSTVPVFSVPPGFERLPKKIVVAVDFAPASVRAAQAALLLLADGGTLTLLHILPPLYSDAPMKDIGRTSVAAIQSGFACLSAELEHIAGQRLTIETRIRTDENVDGIVSVAYATDADLVVVGTHGPTLIERVFVGSVASSVVLATPQAVLAVPPLAREHRPNRFSTGSVHATHP